MSKPDGGPAYPHQKIYVGPDDLVKRRELLDGMTLRQYAAIKLMVPDSGDDWLDEMIQKARRDRFAAHGLSLGAMSMMMMILTKAIKGEAPGKREAVEKTVSDTFEYVDAMLKNQQKQETDNG